MPKLGKRKNHRLKHTFLNPPRVWNLRPLTTKNRPSGWNLTQLEGPGWEKDMYVTYHISFEGVNAAKLQTYGNLVEIFKTKFPILIWIHGIRNSRETCWWVRNPAINSPVEGGKGSGYPIVEKRRVLAPPQVVGLGISEPSTVSHEHHAWSFLGVLRFLERWIRFRDIWRFSYVDVDFKVGRKVPNIMMYQGRDDLRTRNCIIIIIVYINIYIYDTSYTENTYKYICIYRVKSYINQHMKCSYIFVQKV